MDQPPQVGSWNYQVYPLSPAEKKKLEQKKRRGVGFKPKRRKRTK
jgi:hypothetical protein